MSERKLPDWIDSYMEYTENSEPPTQFRRWSAVSAVAACLQRKCYTLWETEVYPNMYVVIIGPAGCRKGTAMAPARRLLESVGVTLAADSTTREALIRRLYETNFSVLDPDSGLPILHSSLTVYSPELAVFLSYENTELVKSVIDWFDCPNTWIYDTKNKGTDSIAGVWVNLIGATTPELLQTMLPKDAVGSGLTSRIVFVYGDRKAKIVPYPIQTEKERRLEAALRSDLEVIMSLQGKFVLSEDFIDKYVDWYVEQSRTPAISDHNFAPYLERRPLHLRKLAMIVSASRSNRMVIEGQDFERALAFLEDVERRMPAVFSGFGRTPIADIFPRLMASIANTMDITRNELLAKFYRDVEPDVLDKMLLTLHNIGFCELERTDKGVVVHWVDEKGKPSVQ